MKKAPAAVIRLTLCATLLILGAAASTEAQPAFTKQFSPDAIGPGSVSTLTFTITNGSGSPVSDLAFTDTLPAALTLADPALASTSCASATLAAADGGTAITLTGGSLGAFSSCTVTVDVTGSAPGFHTNTSGALTSSAGNSGTATDDLVIDITRPGFSKSFSPSTVDRGGRSTLTFTIDNTANASDLFFLDFVDDLPLGMEIADPPVVSTTCGSAPIPPAITAVAGSGTVVFDADGGGAFPAVADGASCTVTVDVLATAGGELDNVSGDLIASTGFSSQSSGRASATLEATVTDMALSKDFTDDPVPPGGIATLEFTIDNFSRNFSANDVAFTDDLGAALAGLIFTSLIANDCGGSVLGVGTSVIDFSGGALPPEGTCTLRVALSVPGGAIPGAYVNTTGAVTGTVDGSPVTGNTASEILFVEPIPVLTKEFLEVGTLAPDPVINPGDSVVMRFTVTNTSTTSGATDVEFLDELTTFLPFPVSVVLPPNPCGAASSVALAFINTDRQGLSLTGGSLAAAPGSGSECSFDVTLNTPPGLAPGVYVNTTEEPTATVDGATRTGRPASDDFTVIAAPRLTKSFTDDPVAPGGTVTLEFTLTHPPEALSSATGISFTDDLAAMVPALAGLIANLPPSPDPPCGAGSSLQGSNGGTLLTLQNGTLAPGESCTFGVTLNVPAAAATGNYANATSGVSATVQGQTTTSPAAADDLAVADLRFTKEFIDDPVVPGDTTTLRFTIENLSAMNDANSISFTDDLRQVLPAGPDLAAAPPLPTTPCGVSSSITEPIPGFLTFVGGEVLAGQSCSFDLTVQVPAGAANGTYANITSPLTATVGGGPVSIDPARDNIELDSRLLELTKEFTDDPVAPGGTTTLRFTLANLDPAQAASSIAFTDDLGAALTGLAANGLPFAACGGTVDAIPDAGTISFSGGSLAAGAQCQFDVNVSVPAAAAVGSFTNVTSGVTGLINGLAVTGDAAAGGLEVRPEIEFSKAFDGPATPLGSPVLTFTITNPGAGPVSELRFTDDLDAMVSGAVASNLPLNDICGPGSTLSGTSLIVFAGGSLAAGATCSFDVQLSVPGGTAAGSYTNTTSELTIAGQPVTGASAADDLVLLPQIDFTKSFSGAAAAGGTSLLTFTIANPGPTAVAGLAFDDDLDAVISGLVATNLPLDDVCGTGSTLTGTSVISLTGGSLAGSDTCTFDVELAVPASAGGGSFTNTTSELTSSAGPVAPAASASLGIVANIPTLNHLGIALLSTLLALAGVWMLAIRRL